MSVNWTTYFKGVAQPYLFLWELFRELQLWDRSETFHGCRADLVGELPFFKFWKLSLVPELYPVYFRNSLIKTDSFRTYWKWKINQTCVFVSLSSGLKLAFFKSSKNNLEIELWVLKVESCSLLLVIWAARQPNGWHDANDNARHLATLLTTIFT